MVLRELRPSRFCMGHQIAMDLDSVLVCSLCRSSLQSRLSITSGGTNIMHLLYITDMTPLYDRRPRHFDIQTPGSERKACRVLNVAAVA